MAEIHDKHAHAHGPNCGHTAIRHQNHVDYVHDGHLHQPQGSRVIECSISVDSTNPSQCTPQHACGSHDAKHGHGAGCGHEVVPHGDHTDYLVAGHLHQPHSGHCDVHGDIVRV